jgi:hypothetical protein
MTPIKEYIEEGKLPDDPTEVKTIKRRACKHTIIEGMLFKRRLTTPLLKCLDLDKVAYTLEEVHEGIAGQHLGGRTLAKKLLRAGYYWHTVNNDSMEYVKRCDKCLRYGDVFNALSSELGTLTTPWPFSKWESDLLGPFHKGVSQVKFLIVVVDYFTMWIEAELLAKITATNAIKFFNFCIISLIFFHE